MIPFSRWLALFGGALLLIVVAASVANAGLLLLDTVTRQFDVRLWHIRGYEDFVRMLTGPALLLFLPYCQAAHGHIVVDFASGLLGGRACALLDRLWQLAAAAIAFMLAYAMFEGMLQAHGDNLRTSITDWLVWPFMIPGIVGVACWGAVCAWQAFRGEPSGGEGA